MCLKNNIFVIKLFLFFVLMVVLPSLVHGFFDASSLSLGIMIASAIVFFIVRKTSLPGQYFFIITIIFLVHYLISLTFFGFYKKSLFSLFAIFFLFYSAYQLSNYVYDKKEAYVGFDRSVLYFLFFLIFILFLALVSDFKFGGAFYNKNKPVFPFVEPSHAALAIAPFFMFFLLRSGMILNFIVFFILMIFSITMHSFMLLIVSFSCYFLFGIKSRYKFHILFFALILLLFFVFKNDYFYQRLAVNIESSNLTALVYLQGLQDAFNALKKTNGFGLGFQMLGYQTPSEAHYRILEVMGLNKDNPGINRYDGGFLAVKIIAEFGLMGILFILFYIFTAFLVIIKIIKLQNSGIEKIEPIYVFSLVCFLSFAYELFIRGVGYFSPGLFFFVFSVFYLRKNLYKIQ